MKIQNITDWLIWQLAKITRLRLWYLATHIDFNILSACYIFICLTLNMAILGAAAYLTSWDMIFPSLGPTIFLMFYAPSSPMSAPRNAILGHAIACIIGYGGFSILTTLCHPTTTGHINNLYIIVESSIVLGLTGVFMTITGIIHPPAASSALIASLGLMENWQNILVLLFSMGVISIQAWLMHRLNGVKFPKWSPFEEAKGIRLKTKLGDVNARKRGVKGTKHSVEELAKILASRQKINDFK